MTTPRNVKRGGDTGYQGTAMETPPQKAKKQSADARRKKANSDFSSIRVKVEHGIGAMKRYANAGKRWRNPRKTRTIIIKNGVGNRSNIPRQSRGLYDLSGSKRQKGSLTRPLKLESPKGA